MITANSGIICNGSSFTIVAAGAATYSYSGGSAVVSPTVTTPYAVSGTSSAGCVSGASAISIVLVNSSPSISATSGTLCEGNTFSIVPTGAISYTYSGGSAFVSPTVSTSYSVWGTSAQGCISMAPAISNITVTAAPLVSVNSGTICQGLTFMLNPTGAISYSFSGGSAVVSPSSTTSYSVMGINSQGCISTIPAIANVVVNTTLSIAVNSGSICEGGTFTIIPSGASTYTYSGGSSIVSPTVTTSYSVVGTATGGCISLPALATVTVYSKPILGINSGAICLGSSFTMVPTGAQTYTFSSGSPVVSPSVNTTYSVTGTSSAGCLANNAVVSLIVVHSLPLITATSGSICEGTSFAIVPSGAATYTISGGSLVVSPTLTSTYSVSGTSSLGCVSSTPALSTVT
ncbi:MAG: hypothetical protein PSX36_02635, partial [bacterium]|nr:hypothetical protein [bacterium]